MEPRSLYDRRGETHKFKVMVLYRIEGPDLGTPHRGVEAQPRYLRGIAASSPSENEKLGLGPGSD